MLKVKDIMSRDVASIQGFATVAKAIQLMKYKKMWALIVERRTGDRTVGIVTKDDIIYKVVAFGRNPKTMRVYEIMTRPYVTVQPEMDIECVARLFASNPILFAPVIGRKPLGIVSASDIKAALCLEQSRRMVLEEEQKTTRNVTNDILDDGGSPQQFAPGKPLSFAMSANEEFRRPYLVGPQNDFGYSQRLRSVKAV